MSLENEVGFEAVFKYATIGIIVVDDGGVIQLVNPKAEALFGYTRAELKGQRIEVLIPNDLHTIHEKHRTEYFKRPKVREMGIGLDLHAQYKNGQQFPVEISLGHYLINGKRMAVAFITDITERKKAEMALKQLNEQLENRVRERTAELVDTLEREKEMSELKSRFVSMASHEFRTPLSTILSSASLIEKYTESDQQDKRDRHIDRIKKSVKNLTDILNDFLSLEKLEQGKMVRESSAFDLSEFVADTVEEVKTMTRNGQTIHYEHSGKKRVVLDPKMTRNILLNLLSNAIKYSGENDPIQVNTAVDKNEVKISVADRGIGIPEEEQRHLFDKFFRAKNTVGIQGTGLGLNIVKRYAELMNGNIDFASKNGEGTTFTVRLFQD